MKQNGTPYYLPLATNNSEEVKKSKFCYCVYCLKRYPASDVRLDDNEDLIREKNGLITVLCPKCGIDAVVPDSCGFEVTDEILKQWHDKGFGSEDKLE